MLPRSARKGFRIAEIPVLHHARKHGHSKYGLERYVRGFLDSLTILFLMQLRLRKIVDGSTARDAAFLLLCLPGSVFFLLPGVAPLCLLICAVFFYLFGNRIKSWKIRLSPIAYGWALSMCGVLSAAVVICLAEGKLV